MLPLGSLKTLCAAVASCCRFMIWRACANFNVNRFAPMPNCVSGCLWDARCGQGRQCWGYMAWVWRQDATKCQKQYQALGLGGMLVYWQTCFQAALWFGIMLGQPENRWLRFIFQLRFIKVKTIKNQTKRLAIKSNCTTPFSGCLCLMNLAHYAAHALCVRCARLCVLLVRLCARLLFCARL